MSKTQTQHTPGWELLTMNGKMPAVRERRNPNGEASSYYSTIVKAGGPPFERICELDFGYGGKSDKANAELIVRAVNSHAQMLAAAKAALFHLKLAPAPGNWASLSEEMQEQLQAAIRAAEGGR